MQEDKKILLIGAGGHCLSVLDSLLASGEFSEIGLIDNRFYHKDLGHAQTVDGLLGIPIVGGDEDLPALKKAGFTHAFIAVGSVGDVSVRQKLYAKIKELGFLVPNILDPSSIVSPFSTVGEGVFVGKHAVINAGARIGIMAIINTSSVVEHDCQVGDFVHAASGCILSGNVRIGANSHLGAGSVVKQGICIGRDVMIGMGSVVLSDIRDHSTAYGNPCKEVKR